MKKSFFILIFITTFSNIKCWAQTQFESSTGIKVCAHIVKLIENDSIIELSRLVKYPLQRPNPLPDITNEDEFITYYPVLFDTVLKQILMDFKPVDAGDESNSEAENGVMYHNGHYGIMRGLIWVNDSDDKIDGVNYNSPAEVILKKHLEHEIKNTINPSLKDFDENEVVGRTDKYLFRVDKVKDKFRYASWHIGHSMKENPDIILYGEEDVEGSGGYTTYVFKNGNWHYEVSVTGEYYLNVYNGDYEDKNAVPFKVVKY